MKNKELIVVRPNMKALYSSIGGEEKLVLILKDFYRRMSQDVLIGFFFSGKDLDKIIENQKHFLLRAMGAHTVYTGKSPAQAHKELPPILMGHFDRRLKILEATLSDFGLERAAIQTWLNFETAFKEMIVTQ